MVCYNARTIRMSELAVTVRCAALISALSSVMLPAVYTHNVSHNTHAAFRRTSTLSVAVDATNVPRTSTFESSATVGHVEPATLAHVSTHTRTHACTHTPAGLLVDASTAGVLS
jgi:hypothetical protein